MQLPTEVGGALTLLPALVAFAVGVNAGPIQVDGQAGDFRIAVSQASAKSGEFGRMVRRLLSRLVRGTCSSGVFERVVRDAHACTPIVAGRARPALALCEDAGSVARDAEAVGELVVSEREFRHAALVRVVVRVPSCTRTRAHDKGARGGRTCGGRRGLGEACRLPSLGPGAERPGERAIRAPPARPLRG